jgi:hypothetical protein
MLAYCTSQWSLMQYHPYLQFMSQSACFPRQDVKSWKLGTSVSYHHYNVSKDRLLVVWGARLVVSDYLLVHRVNTVPGIYNQSVRNK